MARADNLETITLQDLSKIESIYSAPWLLCHRVDLHSELKRLATRDEGPGEPVQIRLNAKVVDIVRLINSAAIVFSIIISCLDLSRTLCEELLFSAIHQAIRRT